MPNEPAGASTLATAYIQALDTDILVTIWSDGTGEIAHRGGPDSFSTRWSAPIPLVMAP